MTTYLRAVQIICWAMFVLIPVIVWVAVTR
jgi:hypothetical protein